jgi:hypothetical protein
MTQTCADSRGFVRVTLRRSAVCLLLLAACDPGEVVLLAPDKSDDHAPALTIQVVVDTPYVALATALGWTDGVPGAQVRAHLMKEPYDEEYWHVATADSLGVARFPSILSGLYEIAVRRPLRPEEVTQTGDATRMVAGGRRMYVSQGAEQAVTVVPDHGGSLIFSEFALVTPWESETGGITYWLAKYIEIYNNSDTTIYLDGKLLGTAWLWNRDSPFWPCAQTEAVRDDPEGIWTEWVARFPGDGPDHPLAPHHTALIALSAIDHRAVLAKLPDLRHADFEFAGSGGVDNPDVPNLEDIGLRPYASYNALSSPLYLANPVDLGSLPRYIDPRLGRPFVRIPSGRILDAHGRIQDYTETSFQGSPTCLDDLNRAFERLPGPAWLIADVEQGLSRQRRVLYVLPDGRKVLQDTNTSMEDFVKAPRTPGWIPDSLGR